MNFVKASIAGAILALGISAPAFAGPIWIFSTSVGTQPTDVGVITLTQINATSVDVLVDLKSTTYGFLNTGGPHTPFAFNLAGSGTLGIDFISPNGTPDGTYASGRFVLNTAGGDDMPYGHFNTALDISGAGNGSGDAYYGDLHFVLSRTGGLDTNDFISNGTAFFAADLTNGHDTGAQAWNEGIDPPPPTETPEPLTLSLFGAGLAGAVMIRRRKNIAA